MTNSTGGWNRETAAHLLMRAAWGATPAEIEQAAQEGLEATLEKLLRDDPDDDLFPEPPIFSSGKLQELRRAVAAHPKDSPARNEAVRELRRAENRALIEMRGWWIARMRYSPCPLRETMTLFWHGHFATSFEKVRTTEALLQQNHLFRDLGLGRFEELTLAVSRDPAMMRYLDIAGSSKNQPNENFARELMELFTLGEGHYTEADVREVARAFTGWRLHPITGQALFVPRRFDSGEKSVLGKTGRWGAEDCVRILCAQPQCASFITSKLWNHFAGIPPTPPVQQRLESAFSSTGGNIRQVLEAIFRSPEFYAPGIRGCRIKAPVEWLVGTLKMLNAPPPHAVRCASALRELGQQLFAPPSVKGWEGGKAWISATTLLARQRLATELFLPAADESVLTSENSGQSPDSLTLAIAQRLMPTTLSPRLLEKAKKAIESETSPLNSASQALRFFLTHPHFQVI